ncbi:MAG TPA: hypothetical protein P5555_13050 [Candidatus Paceibacterota bacterium]|nr:hypothetical protein [Verrucomicrobiota bacterium]HOX03189.1 hypothetical protein [Verrucomicrobiota bacterium]HRZ46111.1 hypothetical protein [Candidatus Paceibacterota bacterium]HRZ54077.1 hypothetical protein [Candidatus Paceibacterota bacterium]
MRTRPHAAWIIAAALLVHPDSCLAQLFCWDNADEDLYRTAEQFDGLNGGDGFEAWLMLNPGPTAAGGSYFVQQASHPEQPLDGDYSWGMNGTYAVGRGLVSPVSAGTWTFLAAHNLYNEANSGFSGFNLKSEKSLRNGPFDQFELLRFGYSISTSPYQKGIGYSTDGGANYEYVGGEDWSGDTLQYSVSWDGLGKYTLSVENQSDANKGRLFVTVTTAGGSVAMLGAAIYGKDLNAESLTFDAYMVPEPPAAMFVLAFTALAVALQRTMRTPSPCASRKE